MPHRIMKLVYWPFTGWAVTFGTAMRGLGGLGAPPSLGLLIAVPNVAAHRSTATVPITILLYNGPLLCNFNVPVKGVTALAEKCHEL